MNVSANTAAIESVITPSSTIAPQSTPVIVASNSHRSTVRPVSAKISITAMAVTETTCAARTITTTPRRPRTFPAAYRQAKPRTVTFTTEFATNGSSRKNPPMKPPTRYTTAANSRPAPTTRRSPLSVSSEGVTTRHYARAPTCRKCSTGFAQTCRVRRVR